MDRLYWQDPETVDLIYKCLMNGQVVVGSSDTVIGLLAIANKAGSELLDRVKGRENKPYIVLLESIKQAEKYVDASNLLQIEKLAEVCWPGPVTAIVQVRPEVQSFIGSSTGTIAIRVPDHGPLRELAGLTGGLFSTSANLSGKPVPLALDQLETAIKNAAAYVVEDAHRQGLTQASTIIDCTQDPWIVVREGAFSIERLLEIPGIRMQIKK